MLEVSVLTALLTSFSAPGFLSYFLVKVPLHYSLLLLCGGNFSYLPCCGEHEGLHFSLQKHSPSSHLSQVNTHIYRSSLELFDHWFHCVELLPFKGRPLCFVETSCWSLSTSSSQNLYYPLFFTFPAIVSKCTLISVTSHSLLILICSLFLHDSNVMILLTW